MPATGKNEGDMPHEKINHPYRIAPAGEAVQDGSTPVSTPHVAVPMQLVVEWNAIGWASIAIYPEGWNDTGDAYRVEMPPAAIDLAIKTLKRAKRQAYGEGQSYLDAYRDHHDTSTTRPLFTERAAD